MTLWFTQLSEYKAHARDVAECILDLYTVSISLRHCAH